MKKKVKVILVIILVFIVVIIGLNELKRYYSIDVVIVDEESDRFIALARWGEDLPEERRKYYDFPKEGIKIKNSKGKKISSSELKVGDNLILICREKDVELMIGEEIENLNSTKLKWIKKIDNK